jgi:hypothetical protein
MNYQPHFDIDYQRGLIGENLVGTFLEALAGSRIEVKTDYRANETGNVYLETFQQSLAGEWYKSGINVTEAEWFVYAGGSANGFLALRTERLVELALQAPRGEININTRNTRATRGRLVPVASMVDMIFRTNATWQ